MEQKKQAAVEAAKTKGKRAEENVFLKEAKRKIRGAAIKLLIQLLVYLVWMGIVVFGGLLFIAKCFPENMVGSLAVLQPVSDNLGISWETWGEWVLVGLLVACWIFAGFCEYELRDDLYENLHDYISEKDFDYNLEHTYNEASIVGNRVEVHLHESHRNLAGVFAVVCAIFSIVIFPFDALFTDLYLWIKYGVIKRRILAADKKGEQTKGKAQKKS